MSGLPPHNLESELALLSQSFFSAATGNNREPVETILLECSPEAFYASEHRLVFRGLSQLYQRRDPIDAVTLLREITELAEVEGSNSRKLALDVARVLDVQPSVTNWRHHLNLVQRDYRARRAIAESKMLAVRVQAEPQSVDALLAEHEASVRTITLSAASEGLVHIGKLLSQQIPDLQHGTTLENRGQSTGLKDLDRAILALFPADYCILAGRPGTGKTVMATTISTTFAKSGLGVAFFSLELIWEVLTLRMLSAESRVEFSALRMRDIRGSDWPALITAATNLSKLPLYIDDTPGNYIEDILSRCLRLRRDIESGRVPGCKRLGLVAIDYLQLCRTKTKGETREREVSHMSQQVKYLAKELRVPVVVLSQLKRPDATAKVKPPQASDLRESGSLEQDADTIILLWKPAEDDDPEAIIAKARNAPAGTKVAFKFEGSTMRYLNADHLDDEIEDWSAQFKYGDNGLDGDDYEQGF